MPLIVASRRNNTFPNKAKYAAVTPLDKSILISYYYLFFNNYVYICQSTLNKFNKQTIREVKTKQGF